MSPDDKLSDWASHAVAPDDPPEPSPDHLDSADDALTKLFGDEVTPDVTHSTPPPSDAPDDASAGDARADGEPEAGSGAGSGAVRIDADPVTGPLPIIAIDEIAVDEPAVDELDGDVGPLVDEPSPVTDNGFGPPLSGGPLGGDDGDEANRSRRQRHKDWRRTEKARRLAARKSVRFPIFTRSVLLWMLIFALVGVAFGASGAFWWANFNKRVSDIEQSQDDFESRSLDVQASIEQQKEQALAEMNDASAPARAVAAEAQMLQLAQTFSPAVYEVATLNEEGLPSAGTAFAVIEDGGDTYFVTSYATIKAATVEPAPDVSIRKGGENIKAEVWNWDPARDLALIKAPKSGVTLLDWVAGNDLAGAVGSRVYPISGTGGAGATLTAGSIIDQSADGIQHTAPLDLAFQGGPMVNLDGKVIAVASLTYAPLGFNTGPQIHFAVAVDQVCQRLITCSGGKNRTPGTKGG